MSVPLSRTLCRTWHQLQRLPRSGESVATQPELCRLLAATVTALFQLYPDHLSPAQYQLLRQLVVLEHEVKTLLPGAPVEESTWQALHETLLAAVVATLSPTVSVPTLILNS